MARDGISKRDRSAHQRRLPFLLVGITLVAAVIGSLGAPLITAVATQLTVSLDAAQWTLTASLFSGAVATPVMGRLGAGRRRRATILIALIAVVIGGLLTVLPLPFWGLLLGRTLQGCAFGLAPMLMGVARDHAPAGQAGSVIGAIAVTTTVGIGVGYPLMGLFDQIGGIRLAYGVGALLSLAALILAWCGLPRDGERPRIRVDIAGAVLLAGATLALLIVIAEKRVWQDPLVGAALLLLAAGCLIAFIGVELRSATPLVDLRLLARPHALRANAAALLAGVGIYLLFLLISRYLQTPSDADYGFGLPSLASGAALIPFSVLGFAASRVMRRMARHVRPGLAFQLPVAAVILCGVLVVTAGDSLVMLLIAMAALGFGLGGVSFIMPALLLPGVPDSETSSTLAVNQIIRTVGFSLGSALTGFLLAQSTPPGSFVPIASGYAFAALWSLPFLAASALIVLLPARRARQR